MNNKYILLKQEGMAKNFYADHANEKCVVKLVEKIDLENRKNSYQTPFYASCN